MGDFNTKSSAKTSTTNRQVGVQGTGAVGISGNDNVIGGQQTRISAQKGSRVNVTTSDFGAINAAREIQLTALSSNQTVALASVGSTKSVAESAINASHQTVIDALGVVRGFQERQSDITEMSVGSAQDIAKQAAPGNTIKFAVGAVIVIAAIAVIYLKTKK